MATEENKAKFLGGKSTENKNSDGNDKSSEQNVGGESGGFKQVDQTATTLKDNAESANNNSDTNQPGQGAAPSSEGNTGDVPDNGPKATEARLEQSKDMQEIGKDKSQLYNPPEDSFKGPTAADLGVDADAQKSDLQKAFAVEAAAGAGVSRESGEVVYSSHPIQNLQIGPYHFEKTVLKLNPQQAADFDKLLESMPLTESRHVTKMDTSRVDEIVQSRLSQGFAGIADSAAGRAALEKLSSQFPKVGTEPIESLQTAHTAGPLDGNTEIPVGEGIPPNPFDAQFNG